MNDRIPVLKRVLAVIEKERNVLADKYGGHKKFDRSYQRKDIPEVELTAYDELKKAIYMIRADLLDYEEMSKEHEVVKENQHEDFVERHPAYATIEVSRPTGGDGIMFGCQSRHDHYVRMTISRASRSRGLSYDRIRSERELIEVQMSYEQWARVVSGDAGRACPVTLVQFRGESLSAPEQINNNTLHMKEFLTEVEEIKKLIDEEIPDIAREMLLKKGTLTKSERIQIACMIDKLKARFASGNGFSFLSKQYLEFIEQVENEFKVDAESWIKTAIESRGDNTGTTILIDSD